MRAPQTISGLSTLVYRQLLRPPGFTVKVPGAQAPISVQAGDWIEAALILRLDGSDRGRLGPSSSRVRLEAKLGYPLDDHQLVARPRSSAKPESPAAMSTVGQNLWTDVSVCRVHEGASTDDTRKAMKENFSPDRPMMLIDHGVYAPLSDDLLANGLLAALNSSGAQAAFPAMNLSEPVSFPMVGDNGSSTQRLPGGRSVWEIADVLFGADMGFERACPARPGAALIVPALAARIIAGESPDVRSMAVTAPSAFAYRQHDAGGVLAGLLNTAGGYAGDWARHVEKARVAVARPVLGRPPVGLYSANVGPWGGVLVLFRLADELQRLGFHACVVHRTTTPHSFRPLTSALKVSAERMIVDDWPTMLGHPEGFLIASHWASGRLCRDVARKHPGVVMTSILQDREDRFEQPNGKPIGHEVFKDYLDIGRGAAVARWIIDSAAEDLGLNLAKYRVIPNGIDADVFHPMPRKRDGKIRVLAMWRPQTEIRRGMKLLREVYDRVHGLYGDRVSLELFGWNMPTDSGGKAPLYAVHHGHQSPEGVARLMAECDIVVEPSLYQGWGLPGSEALACGAALVSTDCLGPREYIVHEQNALMVPHVDLGDALIRVIEDRDLRERLQAAASPSMQKFAWKNIGAMWALYLCELARESEMRSWGPELSAIERRARLVLEGVT